MTPEERAEKIWWIMGSHPERLYYTPSEKKKDIAAQIREAEKEARDKERESVVQYGKEQRWEARRQALEECLKIVVETWDKPFMPVSKEGPELVMLRIRDRIRALLAADAAADARKKLRLKILRYGIKLLTAIHAEVRG